MTKEDGAGLGRAEGQRMVIGGIERMYGLELRWGWPIIARPAARENKKG